MSTAIAKKAEADTDDEKPKGPLTVLPPAALMDQEHCRKVHYCKLPPGATAEDLVRESFWHLASPKLSRHDIIFALGSDESFEAECRVERSSGNGAEVSVVRLIKRKSFASNATVLGDGAFVSRYLNGSWAIVRVADQIPVIRGHATEGAAVMQWHNEQPRKIA